MSLKGWQYRAMLCAILRRNLVDVKKVVIVKGLAVSGSQTCIGWPLDFRTHVNVSRFVWRLDTP